MRLTKREISKYLMKKLLIVESPAKIKTIGKFLGRDFKIMSTFGHVKDLPSKKIGVSISKDDHIELEYVPLNDKEKVIKEICAQAKTCSEVYLASDPDREGEIISWHIGQEIEQVLKDKNSMHRIVFNEITKPAITSAIDVKRKIDLKKVNAQQARRVLDRWVGYEVSPILWRKITKGLSAGRVQSVALMLVCDREEEIINFKPVESWSIHGEFAHNKDLFSAELSKIKNKKANLKNKEQADTVLEALKKESFSVAKIEEKERLKNALPPFMTSTLQQDAYNKLGFSVDKTMSVAQKLYEGVPLGDANNPEALITYMRTDSLRISDTAMKDVRSFIKSEYGDTYLPKSGKQYGKKSDKNTQDAHEAIRPISPERTPESIVRYLKPEQAKLYTLIWRRFVASQMTPAKYFNRVVLLESGDYIFRATGSSLIFDGFLKIYNIEDDDEKKSVKIPVDIKTDDPTDLKKTESKQHFTKPPARYSQATLVKEMEKRDIGRPSTYAATLSTIIKRKYVTLEDKRFHPSELGKSVNELLVQNLPDIINVDFTAQMEQALDKIASGETERDQVLLKFYKRFQKDLEKFMGSDVKKKSVETDLKCPECKKPLHIRFGKAGEFIGCSGFPDCSFTSNFKRDETTGKLELVKQEEIKVEKSDIKCPQCGKELVQKVGKFGPFLACPGYPDCKYIHQETMKMPCPDCGSKIGKRRWRGGEFWGCTSYPKCKFSIFSKLIEKSCPKCKKQPYLLISNTKDKKEIQSCPDKECGYTSEAQ